MAYDKKLMKSYQGQECICCGTTYGTVAHHVKSVGSGGSNNPYNLMVLCDSTHKLIHLKGLMKIAASNQSILNWLELNSWEWCNLNQKYVRYEQVNDNF